MYNEDSPLGVKSRLFAVRITKMVNYLLENRSKTLRPVYDQILRSGTSIMANVAESEFAQSRADFKNKLQIALKEANETKRWLYLLYNSEALTQREFDSMNVDCSELVAMLVSSVNTSRKNGGYEEIRGHSSEGMVSDCDVPLPF